jgi:hypothetical protein
MGFGWSEIKDGLGSGLNILKEIAKVVPTFAPWVVALEKAWPYLDDIYNAILSVVKIAKDDALDTSTPNMTNEQKHEAAFNIVKAKNPGAEDAALNAGIENTYLAMKTGGMV